jgi:plasmid stability protein
MYKHMKRTTLILDDGLHTALRQRAAAEGRTLTDVVGRALRLGLDAGATARRTRVRLPSYDMGPFLADPARRDTGLPPAAAE